jgi:hypothetical protein
MRRHRGLKRGAAIIVLLTGAVGYAAGDWRTVAMRSPGLTAAEAVALRFPEISNDGSPADLEAASLASEGMRSADTAHEFPIALLNPMPMMPQGAGLVPAQAAAPQPSEAALAIAEPASPAPPVRAAAVDTRHVAAREGRQVQQVQSSAAAAQAGAAKEAAAAGRHRANRPGYLLNDAQIASIKGRLNLTPEQEQMWPAVEAALRNIAYAKIREERRRGTSAEIQAASIDPDSAEVQGLKSAAVPLIMSFSAEQKEEVRNIAHVMGLDQLAEQF